MDKVILITILSLIFNVATSIAAPVGSAFSYQGQLMDTGSPANGSYDFVIEAFKLETGGSNIGQEFFTTQVDNGIFTISQVDFGDVIFNDVEIWLQLFVRLSGAGAYTPMTTRQRLNAVPYAIQAEFLAPNGASTGNLLQFDGNDWVASSVIVSSPWTDNGSNVSYSEKVAIGDTASPTAQLHVVGVVGENKLFRVDTAGSSGSKFYVQANGRVGIGTNSPDSILHIKSESVSENPLNVQINGNTKFKVEASGSTTIGTNFASTPTEGLYVHGDVKQLSTANGMMKYMVVANCGDPSNVSRQYNGTEVAGNVVMAFTGATGLCQFVFPTDIHNRFFQASAITDSGNSRVGCGYVPGQDNRITCHRTNNGTAQTGPMTLFIY